MTNKKNTEENPEQINISELFRTTFDVDDSINIPEEGGARALAEFFEISQLENEIGLPTGFFAELMDEDDWSFVIKLHALIEAAITHLLVKHLNEPSMDTVFSFIELSNTRTGKIAFAESLGLIDKDFKRFILTLSQIRNDFVHDVSNVKIEIKEYLSGLEEGKPKGHRKGILLGYKKGQDVQLQVSEELFSAKALLQLVSDSVFDHAPKLSIWFGAILCLSNIYHSTALAEFKVQKQELDERIVLLLSHLIEPDHDAK